MNFAPGTGTARPTITQVTAPNTVAKCLAVTKPAAPIVNEVSRKSAVRISSKRMELSHLLLCE